jgi:hypothetical protein
MHGQQNILTVSRYDGAQTQLPYNSSITFKHSYIQKDRVALQLTFWNGFLIAPNYSSKLLCLGVTTYKFVVVLYNGAVNSAD